MFTARFSSSGRRCLFLLASLTILGSAMLWAEAPKPPAQPFDKDHAAKMAQGVQVFKQHVRPVLMQRCLRCHGGKATEGELDIYSRESLLRGGSRGPAIVPGKARDSLLYKAV